MNTEAIRAKYRELVKYLKDNKLDKPSDTTDFDIYKDGYQQAVKDMADEIAELTKERDDLKQELTTIKSMANICSGEIDDLELTMHQICTIASEALSTQGDSDE